MSYILHIDSTTKVCSIALSKNDKLIQLIELDSDGLAHSEKLHLFIEECLEKANIKPSHLDAISVSKGPGSYTGLRIGVSAAKGLCYGLNIPLIAIDTLTAMAYSVAHDVEKDAVLIPMIDARRVEVFCSIHQSGEKIKEVHARILDKEPFDEITAEKVYYFGDGAGKAEEHLNSSWTYLSYPKTSAKNLVSIAWQKFIINDFEDVAYFEPSYHKNFNAGKPKRIF
ncbi:MAG: tRNA (adenosine(37)-N6)-threonylcarbamoyltransferase complex dimerization subunit type 1 TsaB [Flavobacteriales bacterium]|nr:tRNA (adenosine(37)-N6)-threonylcarbamoyltransferase complex dimerization subunit type 1 TsaB [Flavobacteriales bacterium]